MEEIKINNSKLKIVEISYNSSEKEFVVDKKDDLKYQFVILTDPTDKKLNFFHKVDVSGYKKILINSSMKNYTKCWGLLYEKGIKDHEGIEYSDYERKIILSFIRSTISSYQPEVLELLCRSLNNIENINEKFYNSFGKQGLVEFSNFVFGLLSKNKYKEVKDIKVRPYIYRYDRYSIQDLISDLIKDGACILTDKYLIGEYKTISKTVKDTNSNAALSSESWYRITGFTGNKTRANLSICYQVPVNISIPENIYGIKSGISSFPTVKSMCLVKDGNIWQDKFCVKVSDNFCAKLKRLGIVIDSLLFKNELLINISSLPVVSKSNTKLINSNLLAELEVSNKLSKIALEYLDFIQPKKDDRSDKEKFLESLGIKDGKYVPKNYKISKTGEFYTSVELCSRFLGIPEDISERKRIYKDIIDKKSFSGVIKTFISSIDLTAPIEEVREFWENRERETSSKIKEIKFNLLLSKRFRFSDKGTPFIDTISKKILIGGSHTEPVKEVTVSWSFKTKVVKL